ncbi:hypothetical protein RGQ29_016468 [Quercus rubra]|uniref:Uncharacterized protein n=1 Tax=Quercus rubra TaxID=3512 RepID=A0AAN7FKC3_QUERU|nr:hypothetical protein RGQ29_016468 [Quercus rubra]
MAKLSTFCYVLLLLVISCGEELIPMIEAKQCNKTWNCKGEDRCRADCQNQFKGTGMCDLVTAPSVPKQCFCVYPC